MARNYAALLHEYLEEMDILSDAEFGRLCRALLAYSMDGREGQLEGAEKVLWKRVKNQEDRFQENYKEQAKAKRTAGKRGAAKRWQAMADDGSVMADDGTAINDMADDSKNGYTETKTKTKTETETKDIRGDTPPVILPAGILPSPATTFDRFWAAYPKKVGKGAAQKSFSKVKVPLEQLLGAIERQKLSDQWTRENGRYIPNPATWLNQCRWEDDLSPCVQSQSGETQRQQKAWTEIARQIESGDVI